MSEMVKGTFDPVGVVRDALPNLAPTITFQEAILVMRNLSFPASSSDRAEIIAMLAPKIEKPAHEGEIEELLEGVYSFDRDKAVRALAKHWKKED